jgi:hypothetical protein
MKASTVISYAAVAAAGIALGVAIADTKAGKAIDNGIEKAKTKLGLTREDRKESSTTEEKRSESGERRE